MSAVEVTTYELKKFINLVEEVDNAGHNDLMITASTADEKVLMVGRGGKNKIWKISMVATSEVEGWGEE